MPAGKTEGGGWRGWQWCAGVLDSYVDMTLIGDRSENENKEVTQRFKGGDDDGEKESGRSHARAAGSTRIICCLSVTVPYLHHSTVQLST